MRLCHGVRVKVVYQPRCVVRRRETRVELAYSQLSVLRKGQSNTHRVHALAKVDVIETGGRGCVRLSTSVLVPERLGKERFERGLVRAWVDVAHEDETVEWIG